MSQSMQPDAASFEARVRRSVHAHRGLFLSEGIVLILLGVCAVVVPPIAGLATTVFLGWLFLVAGFVGFGATLLARRAPGFAWSALSAFAALLTGMVLLFDPLQGLVALTYLLIAFFVVDGVLMIALAQSHRRELSGKWGWMTSNGVFDLTLAGIIIVGLPGTLTWALGLMVGIDLVFGGASLVAMALNARYNPRLTA